MQVQDMEKFSQILKWVFAYYEKELTDLTFEMYWNGLKDYSIDEVQAAFNAHLQHPEDGKWWPKVSDIIKNCKGGTQDNALRAWNEVETAIRRVGGYQDVVFHDPLIHQIIHKMGGWIALCDIPDEKSLVFKANEFKNAYRALYATPQQLQPPVELTGIINAQNAKIKGAKKQPPVLIGDPERAKEVLSQLQAPENLVTISHAAVKAAKSLGAKLNANQDQSA
ncbi:DUF6475 domain-containing protein [Hydrogenovibrio marinus]|uniref:DUF6475 domain-containing protein n=1 Tax=Hydrogenovibrio marinus TaxID=28885 RepID=A0A066ZNW3_HYDMR|nr:DUF6475 domain-containing protein [Hydrogenovibrio marinus]KDN95513.1 hypothetical protein EI16_04215 [Hydrogenovibrio marinus]BBN60005.1 hypothetical protein HVMH_1599 [Hydrogenovibrio marinus]